MTIAGINTGNCVLFFLPFRGVATNGFTGDYALPGRRNRLSIIFCYKEAENKEFGYEHFKSLCNSFRYLRHNGCWYGVDTSGKIESPLKQNIVIHIFSADGTQISKVNTKEPEV